MLLDNAPLTPRDFDPYTGAHKGCQSKISVVFPYTDERAPDKHRQYAHDSHGYPPTWYKRQWNENLPE